MNNMYGGSGNLALINRIKELETKNTELEAQVESLNSKKPFVKSDKLLQEVTLTGTSLSWPAPEDCAIYGLVSYSQYASGNTSNIYIDEINIGQLFAIIQGTSQVSINIPFTVFMEKGQTLRIEGSLTMAFKAFSF